MSGGVEAVSGGVEAVSGGVEAAVRQRLAERVPHDPAPLDGACLVWEPAITEALQQAGIAAERVTVVIWENRAGRVLGALHQATMVDGRLVVDLTAQQFSLELPARWIEDIAGYCRRLSAAAGGAEVTVQRTLASEALGGSRT